MNSGENIERKLENMLDKEMSLLNDRDSHLQFKVDRMEHDRERLQQKFDLSFKITWCIIAINIMAMIYMFGAKFS